MSWSAVLTFRSHIIVSFLSWEEVSNVNYIASAIFCDFKGYWGSGKNVHKKFHRSAVQSGRSIICRSLPVINKINQTIQSAVWVNVMAVTSLDNECEGKCFWAEFYASQCLKGIILKWIFFFLNFCKFKNFFFHKLLIGFSFLNTFNSFCRELKVSLKDVFVYQQDLFANIFLFLFCILLFPIFILQNIRSHQLCNHMQNISFYWPTTRQQLAWIWCCLIIGRVLRVVMINICLKLHIEEKSGKEKGVWEQILKCVVFAANNIHMYLDNKSNNCLPKYAKEKGAQAILNNRLHIG